MPLPKEGQSKEDYIKEFMTDPEMISKHPDETQRMAICEDEWKKFSEGQMSREIEEEFTLDKASDIAKPTINDQIIKVFPSGKHFIEKLNRELNFDQAFFTDIQSAFSSNTLSKPIIDKDHGLRRGQSESFGDIKELINRADGQYAKIKLNKSGVELVKNGSYRYISPDWSGTTDTQGNKFKAKLNAISLTNYPALEGALPDLQSQVQLSKGNSNINIVKIKNGGIDMELTKLNEIFSLSGNDSLDIIVEKVTELQKSRTEAENKAIELSKELTAIKSEGLKKEAEIFIKEQVQLEKMHPAIQDIVMNRYVLDKESVIAEYALIPGKTVKIQNTRSPLDNTQLSKEDLEIAKKAGYDLSNADDYRQFEINVLDKKLNKGGK